MHTSPKKPRPLISVIVPIFESEMYLCRCVNSILDQTYSNLEIILIDDGSLDNCPAICDMYAGCDDRIRVLHKTNRGSSDARNLGVSIAKGTLIGFVDSDDYISPTMFERLYDAMENNEADLVICGYALTDENGNTKISGASELDDKVYSYDGISPLAILNLSPTCWVSPCNKLYKRNIVIPFPLGIVYGEDAFVAHHIIDKCKCIATIHDEHYYYVQRSGSIMHTFNLQRLDACDAYQDCFAFCKARSLKRAAGYALITTAFVCLSAFKQLREKDGRKRMWRYIRWVSVEILKHPLWFLSVLPSEIVRYRQKEAALRS